MDLKEDFVVEVIKFLEFVHNEMNASADKLTVINDDFQLSVTLFLIVTSFINS